MSNLSLQEVETHFYALIVGSGKWYSDVKRGPSNVINQSVSHDDALIQLVVNGIVSVCFISKYHSTERHDSASWRRYVPAEEVHFLIDYHGNTIIRSIWLETK